MPTPTLDYHLRAINSKTWVRAMKRAQKQGQTMRFVLLQFIEEYARGDRAEKTKTVTVAGPSPLPETHNENV